MRTHADPERNDPPRPPLAITRAGIIGTILVGVVVATCVRLGVWQLSRLEQRRELNAGIAARLQQEPIGDVTRIADTIGAAYRVATAAGLYDNERAIVLPGRSHRGVPGVHLIAPLRLAGRTDALLVNRGWIPSPDAATIDVMRFAVRDSVMVRGLVLPFPDAAQSLAQRGTARDSGFRRIWFTIDESALRGQYPYALLHVMLQELGAPGDSARYPVRLGPPPLDEGPHLGYALQWFSFALIGIVGWFALVLRSRAAPRAGAAASLALAALFAAPATGHAQLRPLDPLEWRVFDTDTWLVAGAGAGLLWQQPAPLAGTRGRLHEIGRYSLALRSGRIAILVGGTALWQLSEQDTLAPAAPGVAPADGVRQDAGVAYASTAFRVSPDRWPADVALRFGVALPTTSDESGLDRDRTDFFALLSARFRHGDLTLSAENGVGINGTIRRDLPQSDVWTYAYGAAYRLRSFRLAADLVGRQDGHAYVIRGNEDLRELQAGFDIGHFRWLRVRYIRGFAGDASPAHGVRVSAGFALRPT